jgi:hypothetical protein
MRVSGEKAGVLGPVYRFIRQGFSSSEGVSPEAKGEPPDKKEAQSLPNEQGRRNLLVEESQEVCL